MCNDKSIFAQDTSNIEYSMATRIEVLYIVFEYLQWERRQSPLSPENTLSLFVPIYESNWAFNSTQVNINYPKRNQDTRIGYKIITLV